MDKVLKNLNLFGRQKKYLILFLILVHLLPIWIFKYFPSQDGPPHIYNAYVLKEYHNNEHYKLRECYKLNLGLFPNLVSHLLMAALMYVVPPLFAEKILLSLCISLLPLSLFYFLDAYNKGKNLFGFLGFLFSYNLLLHMGFYNFSLGVSLYFFALGYWLKNKDSIAIKNITILNLLLIITYFCHILPYLLALLSLLLLSITSFRDVKKIVTFSFTMFPLHFILLINYLLPNVGVSGAPYYQVRTLLERVNYFVSIKSLVCYGNKYQLIITRFLFLIIVFLFILTVWKEKVKARKIISSKDSFLLLSIIMIILYFFMPWGVGSHSNPRPYWAEWINDRLNFFSFLLLLPWFSESYHRRLLHALVAVMILLSLSNLAIISRDYYFWNKELKEFTSGTSLIEKNKVLSARAMDDREGSYFDIVPMPLMWAASYYCINNGGVYLDNYEASLDYFPVNFSGTYSGIVDYVLAWKTSGADEKDYDIIKSTENLKLFRHKKVPLTNDSLVLYFPFDEGEGNTVTDFSGKGNDGTIIGEPVPEWVKDGKYGGGLKLTPGAGTHTGEGFVEVPDSKSFDFCAGLTVEAWVKPEDLIAVKVVASQWAGGVNREANACSWTLETHDNKRYYAILNGGRYQASSGTAAKIGEWQHIAFTWDGSTIRFYYNGLPDGATSHLRFTLYDSNEPLRIGRTDRDDFIWAGLIDEVKIWNRALTIEEIRESMQKIRDYID